MIAVQAGTVARGPRSGARGGSTDRPSRPRRLTPLPGLPHHRIGHDVVGSAREPVDDLDTGEHAARAAWGGVGVANRHLRPDLQPRAGADGQAVRALVVKAGFRGVRVRADVKLSRWQSAEHFVRSLIAGAPTMLGALVEQGPGVLDTIVTEVADATADFVDDEGWATPQSSNIITAIA